MRKVLLTVLMSFVVLSAFTMMGSALSRVFGCVATAIGGGHC